MKTLKQGDNIWTVVKALAVVIICLLYSVKSNGVTGDILSVPLNYINSSDSYNWYLAEKNLLETGNILYNPRLGAPFISELYDFPVFLTFKFDLLVLQFILSFFRMYLLLSIFIM